MSYLTVDEQATYIDVFCDGFVFRASTDTYIAKIRNSGNTADVATMPTSVYEGGGDMYTMYNDSSLVMTLQERTNTRVTIQITGNYYYSSTPLGSVNNKATYTFYIYPDRVIVDLEYDATDADAVIINSYSNTAFGFQQYSCTSLLSFYESSGVDTSGGTNASHTTDDYTAFESDQVDLQAIHILLDATCHSRILNAGYLNIGFNNTTLDTVHRSCIGYLINQSTNRLTLGEQYTRETPPTINVGDGITDLNIPGTIGNALASDGAYHVDLDSSHEAKVTFNQSEINPAIVLHEASVRTGAVGSPDEHVDSLWDCDSTTLNIGTGSVTVTNATYDTGIRGNGVKIDASAEVAYYQSSGNITAAQGTISFDVKCTGTATANARFFQHSSAPDEFELYWTNATTIAGNINQTAISFTVAIDPLDGEYHHMVFKWDCTNDIHSIIIDNQIQNIITTAVTAPDFSSGNLYIGNSSAGTNPINGITDNWMVLNAVLHNYGTFIPGNLTDYSKAHSDITAYSDNGSSWDIGTGVIGDIDNAAGSVLFNTDNSSALSSDETLFEAGTLFKIEWVNAANDIELTYGSVTIQTTNALPSGFTGEHIISAHWLASGDLVLMVDGVKYTSTASTAPTLGSSITWSSNVGMDRKSIVDDSLTPQLPFIPGVGAIHAPLITGG